MWTVKGYEKIASTLSTHDSKFWYIKFHIYVTLQILTAKFPKIVNKKLKIDVKQEE